MNYTIGIDIGSTTSKCILMDKNRKILARSLVQAGTGTDGPKRAYEQVLKEARLAMTDVAYTMATGYGRTSFEQANENMSELSCHAKGVYNRIPGVRTIIDIGGQDAKVIRINEQGGIANFVMNDKCAAGTGRFLDVMANILQLEVSELEGYALKAKQPAKISSTCTVFAESEVISQLSKNVELSNLIAGICDSVASRVAGLAKRIGIQDKVCMSGGVAKNGGVRKAIEKELNTKVYYTEDSQYMGAIGAAIAAWEKTVRISENGSSSCN